MHPAAHTPPTAPSRRRAGATTLEAALVIPIVLFLLLALVVGGTGVFLYQQVACQAREAARWASVRGGDYQKELNQPSPDTQTILQQAVLPKAVAMESDNLSLSVRWVNKATGVASDWDAAPKDVKSVNPAGEYVTNSVRVTVTYQWSPGVLLGNLTLTSTSELPMSF
jgi:Flp pilus assembly protein TadG